MIDQLFESMQTLSPRLKWMKKRNIYCVDTKKGYAAYRSGSTHTAFSSTEEQACLELASKLKIKSWKEMP